MSQVFAKSLKLYGLCAIGFITLAVYANSLASSFHFDDLVGIVSNPTIRSLSHIPSFFTDPHTFALGSSRDWRPILQTTYALNYFIAGLDPMVFRLFNLLFHIGSAFLVFVIVVEVARGVPGEIRLGHPLAAECIGLLSALLFALHTANDQAVNYIWARSSVLAAFFYLTAFYSYVRGPFSPAPIDRSSWHAGALVAFALGLGTKASVTSLPVVLLVYEMLFLNPGGQNPVQLFSTEPRRIKKYLPLAILLLGYIAIRLVLVRQILIDQGGSISAGSSLSFVTPYFYLLTQFRAWVFYLKLFIWPYPLSIDYSDFGWSRSFWEPGVLGSLALVIAILLVAWLARKSWPLISFFTLWFFITLLPEASFIPLADAVVGYRAYLPYVGTAVVLILASQTGWHWLWNRLVRENQALKIGCWSSYGAVIGAAIVILAGATINRNRVWLDDATLWSDVLSKDSKNPRAYMALGVHLLKQKNLANAEIMFERAIQLAPETSNAYALRGYLKAIQKRNDQALADYATAIKLDRRSPYVFAYRGDLYNRLDELDKALADFQTAIKLLPSFGDAHFGAAMVYIGKEDIPNATASCQKLVEIDPDDRRGYDCLGALLIEQSRLAEAIKVYQQATARLPEDSELWANLGNAYRKNGMHSEAARAFAKATALMVGGKGQLP